jgi:hypothetical protein
MGPGGEKKYPLKESAGISFLIFNVLSTLGEPEGKKGHRGEKEDCDCGYRYVFPCNR